jgi:hypothetical protein
MDLKQQKNILNALYREPETPRGTSELMINPVDHKSTYSMQHISRERVLLLFIKLPNLSPGIISNTPEV